MDLPSVCLSVQHINPAAASLIQKMLQHDPAARPTIDELLNEEFFTVGYIPSRLPTTCLTVPPRFSLAPSSLDPSSRRPLAVVNKGELGRGFGGAALRPWAARPLSRAGSSLAQDRRAPPWRR